MVVIATTPKHKSVAAIFGIYIGGLMFLPELAAFDFPLLPPMDKNGFAAAMSLVAAILLERKRIIHAKPLRGVDAFFWLMLLGDIGTAFTNRDVLVFGEDRFRPTDGLQYSFRVVLDDLKPYDIMSMAIRDFLSTYVPFLVGRAVFREAKDAEVLLRGMVTFCLIYTPLCLLEMRLSPQLHNWVYGYAPSKFGHAMRGSGYKPIGFMANGLAVAMFLVAGVLSAAILHKRRAKILGFSMALPLGILWLVLGLSRNVGATIFSLIAVPIVLMSRGRMALTAAMILVISVVVYPIVRATDAVDVYYIIERIEEVSPDRAQSLDTRFRNEDSLYDRAEERLWFGWGGFGRNRIFDDWGKDVSITDGEWILRIGGRGVVGFVACFAFLMVPIVMAWRKIKKIPSPEDRKIVDSLSLLVALNAVDLLPNALFTQMPFLLAGALAGLVQGMSEPKRR